MRFIILLFLFLPFASIAESLPPGWRLPEASEITNQKLMELSADFNGDGVNDSAYLLKSISFSGEGLFVLLSIENGTEWQMLERISWGPDYPNAKLSMSIELAQPGNYLTACGKGQWQCDEYETAEFGTTLPGIWYSHSIGHKSIFYWNAEKNKFDKQWISN